MHSAGRRAVFLDRDGVLVEDHGYVFRESDLHLLPGVAEALASLKARGFLLIVVTNQSGVARGMYAEADVVAFHTALNAALVEAGGVPIDAFFYCPHHPEATVSAYRVSCDCRKPNTGMFRAAIAKYSIAIDQSYMIGDRAGDISAGLTVGLTSLQIIGGSHALHPQAHAYVDSLQSAVMQIV